MFEEALRNKYRFESQVGTIDTEDLFDLPVEMLDGVFKTLNSQLQKSSEESLLDNRSDEDTEIENKIAIVKHIFDVKIAEKMAKAEEKDRAEKKQRIMEIMKQKQDQSLQEMSEEDLQKMLDEI